MGRRQTGPVSLMPPGLGTSPQSRPQAHPSMLLLEAQRSIKGQVWTKSWVRVLTSHMISDTSLSLSRFAQPQVDPVLFLAGLP